jgi:large subunit ribosomal protein L18
MAEHLVKKTRKKRERRRRAHLRVRRTVHGTTERPRLAVFKSLRYVYAQVIDDQRGVTLAAASSLEPGFEVEGSRSSKAAARQVGEAVAKRAKEAGIEQVVFDRGGYRYHGKVRELAEGARDEGLDF